MCSFFVNHCSKMSWVYPMETRNVETVMAYLKNFVDLSSIAIKLKHFHSDGGAELIASGVLDYVHSHGATTSHSHSVTEIWVKSLKDKMLCMLLRSSLPIAFWWFAVLTAIYIE